MKRYYLIDLENVGRTFLEGIDKLTPEDVLVVCHNKVLGDRIPMDIESKLKCSRAIVKYLVIENSFKNAMDFCLCTQLGYLVAENGHHAKYFIVSNDKGFDTATDFARSLNSNITVRRISSLKADFEEEREQEEIKQTIHELLKGHHKKVISMTIKCFNQCDTCFAFHNMLQKHLNREEFVAVYNKVKHLYPIPTEK